METKACTICGVMKPLTSYSKGNGRSGLRAYCKTCQTEMMRKYRAANQEKARELPTEKRCPCCEKVLPGLAFYVARGEKDGLQRYCKTCQDAKNIAVLRKDPQKRSDYRAEFHRHHWAKYRAMAKDWRRNNTVRHLGHMRRYQARKRGATVENVDYELVWTRDKGVCYLCGLPVERSECHFDHVIPLSRGGAHSFDNVRVTHAVCNLHKHAKLPDELTQGCT